MISTWTTIDSSQITLTSPKLSSQSRQQATGDWTVSIVVEYDADYPDKPAADSICVEDTVGIDLGVTTFIHDSDNRVFARLDEVR
ncbi:hypothetical protein [Haloquadratum walsbyi]|uniref:hypothetical protein n=1 Tax=Haloquadratum walsbyi TaxID=293091 RepID=UPI0026ECE1B8|nr:hypothetical protein [Haloquadratum walsbyi]